jgi:UDP-glucose:(heptosyl)LPS alpha-1,3-glucosyltransferase
VIGRDRPERYERQAQRLGCPDLVRFVGGVADSVPYYAAADVYLHPTYYDPCSLVVLEALAGGLPVITTVHNGAGELMTPGVHGFVLADPTDVRSLVGHMEQLMDSTERSACSRRARELAEQHDLERNYREILAVYEEAARIAPLTKRKAAA